MTINKQITIDPCKMFRPLTPFEVVERCGDIPEWVMSSPEGERMEDTLTREMPWLTRNAYGGIDRRGAYCYPNLTLYPLIRITSPAEVLHLYNGGVVAIQDRRDGSHVILKHF